MNETANTVSETACIDFLLTSFLMSKADNRFSPLRINKVKLDVLNFLKLNFSIKSKADNRVSSSRINKVWPYCIIKTILPKLCLPILESFRV